MLAALLPLLLLPAVAADLSAAFGGLFSTTPPLLPFTTTLSGADGNLYRNTDEYSCRILPTKPVVASGADTSAGGWTGPTCSSAGVAGYAILMWAGGNATVNGYSGGSVAFINQTDVLEETYASAPASRDNEGVYELGTLPAPYNGFWQVQIRGPLEFGLTSVGVSTALNSNAPDFASVGRRTEFAVVDGAPSPFFTTTREWSINTNYTNFPTLKSPGGIVAIPLVGKEGTIDREVTTPATLSNLSFAIPANTSYLALAGLSDGQMSSASLFLTFGNTVRELPLRYGSVFHAPVSLFQLALNPTVEYAAVVATENGTRPVSFHSATFYSSLWPLPEGYTSGNRTAVSFLDYIDGNPAPSPIDPNYVAFAGGTASAPATSAVISATGVAGTSPTGAAEKKSNNGAIIGGAVGGGLGALALAGLAFFLVRRKRNNKRFQKPRESFIIEETDPGLTPFKEEPAARTPASGTPGNSTPRHPVPAVPAIPAGPSSAGSEKSKAARKAAMEDAAMPLSAGPKSASTSAPQSFSQHGRAMDGDDDVQRLPPMYNPAWNAAHSAGVDSSEGSPITPSPSTPQEHKNVITSGQLRLP